MAQNSGAPRSQEDYITQVSEEIEGRVTKRLSKEPSLNSSYTQYATTPEKINKSGPFGEWHV